MAMAPPHSKAQGYKGAMRAFIPVFVASIVAACQVTVVPGAPGGPDAPPFGIRASGKPVTAPSGDAGSDDLHVAPWKKTFELPADAEVGQPATIVGTVIMSSGCVSFVDADAEVDEDARQVTFKGRVSVRAGGCGMALGYHPVEHTFTPRAAGTWKVVAVQPEAPANAKSQPKAPDVYFEVAAAGTRPTPAPEPSPAPSATPTPIADPTPTPLPSGTPVPVVPEVSER